MHLLCFLCEEKTSRQTCTFPFTVTKEFKKCFPDVFHGTLIDLEGFGTETLIFKYLCIFINIRVSSFSN